MGTTPVIVHEVLGRRGSLERQICKLGELAEEILNHPRATDTEITRVDGILQEIDCELRELIEIKKSNGFFKELLDAAPEARHSIDVLMRDHENLVHALSQMRDELPQAEHSLTVRRHLHGWIQRFREFDSREITLLQSVWNVDVGAAD